MEYVAALMVFSVGMVLAARHYPGGYDWPYTVISALASQKHNPAGSVWFAGALSLSMVLLWPYVSVLTQGLSRTLPASAKFTIFSLRIGVIFAAVVGVERLLFRDISSWLYKSHELLALVAILALYIGILGLLIQVMHRRKIYIVPVVFVATPLMAIFITQLWLYIQQSDLGWTGTGWREKGVPLWLSFAFWQWLEIAFLWIGLGLLSFHVLAKGKH